MKKMLLSLALLCSTMSYTAFEIAMSATIDGETFNNTFTVDTLQDQQFTFTHDNGMRVEATAVEQHDGVEATVSVYRTDDSGNYVLHTKPVIHAAWDEQATVTLATECPASSAAVTIKVSRTS